jgi:ankyrin repeat protein
MRKTFFQLLWAGALMAGAVFAASDVRLPDAAMNGDKAAVKAMLKQKIDANSAQPDGTTALHWAAHQNDLELVNALLQSGANVKAANRYGITPLAEAVQKGSAALVEALLKAGADPNTLTTDEGETVLMTASRTGNAEAVKLLLAKGANVNAVEGYRGQTALMWAAAEEHPDIVKVLLAAKADPNLASVDRDTTLPKLPAGSPAAPISRGGLRAIHFAARQGSVESMKALLDAGVDINQGDVDKNSPLLLAILNSHYDLAQVLIDHGAKPNVANKDGRAALLTAVEMRTMDWSPRPFRRDTDKLTATDIIHSLVDHGADVNQQLTASSAIERFAQDHGDKNLAEGATPFMRAARSVDMELMQYLISKGADPKHASKSGLNALLLAAGVGWSEKIKGTEAQAIDAVKFLLDQGMDLNAITDRGDTVMHGAAMRGADNLVKFLAEKGAKLDVKNKQSLTPLDIAMGKGGAPGVVRDAKESTMKVIRDLMKARGPQAQNVQN